MSGDFGCCGSTNTAVGDDQPPGPDQSRATEHQANGESRRSVTSGDLATSSSTVTPLTLNLLNCYQHPYTPELQVLVNQDNAIECSVANGNPAPKITWLLNGKNITDHVSAD